MTRTELGADERYVAMLLPKTRLVTSSRPPSERRIDAILDASFPASDPPPWTLGVETDGEPVPAHAVRDPRVLLAAAQAFERARDPAAALSAVRAAASELGPSPEPGLAAHVRALALRLESANSRGVTNR